MMTADSSSLPKRWRRYPKYTPSAVEWLGDVPQNWVVLKLKHASQLITDGSHYSPPACDIGLPYVTVSDVKNGTVDIENCAKISKEDFELLEKNGCKPKINDVLFSKDGTIGKIVLVDRDDFVILSSLAIIRPKKIILPNFLRYFFASKNGIDQMELHLVGAALRRITLVIINEFYTIIPPLPEQHAIAAFLDRETARIDALIAKKERQIELLHEKRAALISHAVTKGLDPNVKMKDSGIEWLGIVPEGWEVSRLGWHVDLLTGFPFKSESFSFEGGVKLVRGDNVTEGILRWGDKTRYWTEITDEIKLYTLNYNDILIGMDGSKIGKNYARIKYEDLPLLLVQRVARLRTIGSLTTDFLFHLIGSDLFYTWVQLTKTDPAIPHISPKDIQNYNVCIPPIEHQNTITTFLDRENEKIGCIIANINGSVEKLKEYRSALISAAVTGKIDVRPEARMKLLKEGYQ